MKRDLHKRPIEKNTCIYVWEEASVLDWSTHKTYVPVLQLCRSVLQLCCSVLQCVAVCCSLVDFWHTRPTYQTAWHKRDLYIYKEPHKRDLQKRHTKEPYKTDERTKPPDTKETSLYMKRAPQKRPTTKTYTRERAPQKRCAYETCIFCIFAHLLCCYEATRLATKGLRTRISFVGLFLLCRFLL